MAYPHPIDGSHVLALALGFAIGALFFRAVVSAELNRLRTKVAEMRRTRLVPLGMRRQRVGGTAA